MTAIVLPELDRSTIDELKKRIPNLSEFELPNLPTMEQVGKTADQTIDRLLGRSRAPVWPWIAAGIGLVALLGVVAAWFAWFRRPEWTSGRDTWSTAAESPGDELPIETDSIVDSPAVVGTGLTAAESSHSTTPYPIEEA